MTIARDIYPEALPALGAWAAEGACRDQNPALFFPERTTQAGAEYDAARAVCASCPALEPCRAYGLENDPPGMWGGLSERDRRRIRRESRPRPVPVVASGPQPRCPGCRWPTTGIPVSGGLRRECPRCGARWAP